MAKADWSAADNGAAANFSKNKALDDAKAAGTQYSSSTTTYNSPTTYYNGYNPDNLTPEGETTATWQKVSE